ncbi:LysR family transcriptional regulator [Saccharospirillum salsuginis]|uniref:HTH lysR-type domain-containing protein n=1 Tax=Saccharospirillum salsuginis TaxID=418750 RepID=A0A918K606_9GAMM|nr:LysR family transcriptional regulator [Saccharospirillum salsuginis]GGX48631.1 hypothetical protein GCM10007392_14640 [Saccharospirillum salsuginis]
MEKSLRQFLMVAEMRSLSHAAKRLFISQPTLTHNMKKLEESLGVELFVRSPKGMSLTAYGEALLEQARIMRRVHENTLSKLEQMRTRQERGLKVGVGFAWWQLFFRDLFREYRAQHPGAPAHIDIANHLRSMDQLLSGDIDLFIGHKIVGLSPRSGAVFMPLFRIYDKCFVRPGHPLLGRPCSLDALLDYPHVDVTPDESRYRRQVIEDTQLKEADRNVYHLAERVVWSSNSMSASLDIMLESDAVMTYTGTLANYLAQFGICELDIIEPQGPFTVGLYTLGDRVGDEMVNTLVRLIGAYLPGIADQVDMIAPMRDGQLASVEWIEPGAH